MVMPNLIGRMLQLGDSTIGAKVDAGLPNITGKGGYYYNYGQNSGNGALTQISDGGGVARGSTSGTSSGFLYLDASKSNPIYGSATTVQPPAINMIPMIKY